mmetsp:Transcript_55175/g.134074  ORF Transcript_55175/g.134074 Transcript_55175/m.134074 type:complete len:199 (-) Transcript_55175:327-923(-)
MAASTGIDFKKAYLDNPGFMDTVCDKVIQLCDEINKVILAQDHDFDKSRKPISLLDLKNLITNTAKDIEQAQIDEFRRILILLMCALSGLFLEPHPINNKLAFVSEHTGAYNIVLEAYFRHYFANYKGTKKFPDKPVEDFTIMEMKNYMPALDTNELEHVIESLGEVLDINEYDRQIGIEVLACESQPKRANANVVDF